MMGLMARPGHPVNCGSQNSIRWTGKVAMVLFHENRFGGLPGQGVWFLFPAGPSGQKSWEWAVLVVALSFSSGPCTFQSAAPFPLHRPHPMQLWGALAEPPCPIPEEFEEGSPSKASKSENEGGPA